MCLWKEGGVNIVIEGERGWKKSLCVWAGDRWNRIIDVLRKVDWNNNLVYVSIKNNVDLWRNKLFITIYLTDIKICISYFSVTKIIEVCENPTQFFHC